MIQIQCAYCQKAMIVPGAPHSCRVHLPILFGKLATVEVTVTAKIVEEVKI